MKTKSEMLRSFLKCAKEKEYEKVISTYKVLSEEDQLDSQALYYLAGAFYAIEDDVKSLREYCKFVKLYPENRATNYAKMGMVACLKNLELHDQALEVLLSMPSNHKGVLEEQEYINKVIRLQFQAKSIYRQYKTPLPVNDKRELSRC